MASTATALLFTALSAVPPASLSVSHALSVCVSVSRSFSFSFCLYVCASVCRGIRVPGASVAGTELLVLHGL